MTVEVQSVAFGNGQIEVTYFEPERNDSVVQEIKTIVFPAQLVEDTVADLHDSIVQMIDEVMVVRRNPPARFERAR